VAAGCVGFGDVPYQRLDRAQGQAGETFGLMPERWVGTVFQRTVVALAIARFQDWTFTLSDGTLSLVCSP
jgi:hypothetical protein